MSRLKNWYVKSGWRDVFNMTDEDAKARVHLLTASISGSLVTGFSSGIFYTGLLLGYGLNIVNISIVTLIPYIASLFSIFTPYILERFTKRRNILTFTYILYFTVNILGTTLLPTLVHNPQGRTIGLIAIVFVASAIDRLFIPGYQPWHSHYIMKLEIRNAYSTTTTLASNILSSIVLVSFSAFTDKLEGDAQLRLIIIMRYISFGIAMLQVYFLQKPKEPDYPVTTSRPSLLDIFRIPLSNKKFRMTMWIYGMFSLINNLNTSVYNTWLLEDVQANYLYINIINAMYAVAIICTSGLWNRVMLRNGTFKSLSYVSFGCSACVLAAAFINKNNYLWLMTIIRLTEHAISLLQTFSVNNLIYVNLPRENQTSFFAFSSIMAQVSTFVGMTIGTFILTLLGDHVLNFLGYSLSGVPLLTLVKGIIYYLFSIYVFKVRRKVEDNAYF